jgi:hypothetical protein
VAGASALASPTDANRPVQIDSWIAAGGVIATATTDAAYMIDHVSRGAAQARSGRDLERYLLSSFAVITTP